MALGGQCPLPGDLTAPGSLRCLMLRLTAPGHNRGRAPILLQDSDKFQRSFATRLITCSPAHAQFIFVGCVNYIYYKYHLKKRFVEMLQYIHITGWYKLKVVHAVTA